MRVAIDIESDNLFPFITKIHCMSVLDIDTGAVSTFRECPRNVDEWELVVAHNLLGFDYWALWKVWGVQLPLDKCVDTLVYSRTLWPDRPWQHSLENWGERLGIPKLPHSDFSVYSEEMRLYCENDVKVCAAIYRELIRERDQ